MKEQKNEGPSGLAERKNAAIRARLSRMLQEAEREAERDGTYELDEVLREMDDIIEKNGH
jgi:hypothetical protein